MGQSQTSNNVTNNYVNISGDGNHLSNKAAGTSTPAASQSISPSLALDIAKKLDDDNNPADSTRGVTQITNKFADALQSTLAADPVVVAKNFGQLTSLRQQAPGNGTKDKINSVPGINTSLVKEFSQNFDSFIADQSSSEIKSKVDLLHNDSTAGPFGSIAMPSDKNLSFEKNSFIERANSTSNVNGNTVAEISARARFLSTNFKKLKYAIEALSLPLGAKYIPLLEKRHEWSDGLPVPVAVDTADGWKLSINTLEFERDGVERSAAASTNHAAVFVKLYLTMPGDTAAPTLQLHETNSAASAVTSTHPPRIEFGGNSEFSLENTYMFEFYLWKRGVSITLAATPSIPVTMFAESKLLESNSYTLNLPAEVVDPALPDLTKGIRIPALHYFGYTFMYSGTTGPHDIRQIWMDNSSFLGLLDGAITSHPDYSTVVTTLASYISSKISITTDTTVQNLAESMLLDVVMYPDVDGPIRALRDNGASALTAMDIALSALNFLDSLASNVTVEMNQAPIAYTSQLKALAAKKVESSFLY